MVTEMRILGVLYDSQLNFINHVRNVCNKLRRCTNLLWRFKKLGVSVRHAVQYVLCLQGHATFWLWWVSGLSNRSWTKLETVWNNLIRMALHEKCPKKLRADKAQEFTGLRGLKRFFLDI